MNFDFVVSELLKNLFEEFQQWKLECEMGNLRLVASYLSF